MSDDTARKQVEEKDAKVLSNRKPPYSIKGGLFDAMMDAGGEIFGITNQEARAAAKYFTEKEGNDIEPAAAVAVASLIEASKNGAIDKNKTIMLNITGGGVQRFKNSHDIHYLTPLLTFPINPDPQSVIDKVSKLF
jgi:cysteate synthase